MIDQLGHNWQRNSLLAGLLLLFVTMAANYGVGYAKLAGRYDTASTIATAPQVTIALQTNDPDLPKQEYLGRVRAYEAWDIVRQKLLQREMVIAILDTGVDVDHADLASNIWKNTDEIPGDGVDNDENSYIDDVNGWDFVSSVSDPRPKIDGEYSREAVHHGTIVAGIIAATADNNFGIAGAGYRVKVMPLRVLNSSGSGNTLVLAQGIDYAVENGADVINLSLVGDIEDPRLSNSIADAYAAGVAIVAASGNQEHTGLNLNVSPRYPVCEAKAANRIIGVAAVDDHNKLAAFSNYGSDCIDISAPGTNMYSTVWHRDGNPDFSAYYSGGWSGSSAATPLVASTLALIKGVAPTLRLPDVYRALLTGAVSLEGANYNYLDLGSGLLDMKRSLENAVQFSREEPLRVLLAPSSGFEPRLVVQDKQGITVGEFYAYAKSFRGGVNAAVGDVDGDGQVEIVTVPASRGGPHVRIFDMQGALKGQFMAYARTFVGGLSVAVADVTGDGTAEIITAPTSAGGPQVRIFNASGSEQGQFMAYSTAFRGGVRVAAADLDGDRIAEIVTAPASGGGPHVRIFGRDGSVKSQFMAFDPAVRGGYSVVLGDVDGDATGDVVVARESDSNVQARIFSMRGEEKNRFPLFPELTEDEEPVHLAIGDYTGDGQVELARYMLRQGTSLKLFDYFGRVLDEVDPARVSRELRSVRYSIVLTR